MQTKTLAPLGDEDVRSEAAKALLRARAQINRSYLAELATYEVTAISDVMPLLNRDGDVRIFHVERIVHENKQSVLESATATYTALGAAGYAVFLFLSSDGRETQLFIGARGAPTRLLGSSAGKLMQEVFKGHFAGSSLRSLTAAEVDSVFRGLLGNKQNPAISVTAVTGVPSLSANDAAQFVQGLERFVDAAERRVYQAMILAEPVTPARLEEIRIGYEATATELTPLRSFQLSYGEQDSETVGANVSRSLSETLGHSLGLTETHGESLTLGTSTNQTTGSNESESSANTASKLASMAGTVVGVAATLTLGPAGPLVGAGAATTLGVAFAGQRSKGSSTSDSRGTSESVGSSSSLSAAKTQSYSAGDTTSQGASESQTQASSRQMTIEWANKGIEQLLSRIEHHLARLDEARTYGGWNSAAYFIADGTASSEALSSMFLGLVRGKGSSEEDFALTTWQSEKKDKVLDWLGNLSHPLLQRKAAGLLEHQTTPATLLSGREVAIQLSLPRRSTTTVSVVETQAFGRRVHHLDGANPLAGAPRSFRIGRVRHLWENTEQEIQLSLDQLTSHVFVSGSTGAGKSNAIYHLLKQLHAEGIPFLVIEPAKGEYKHVFGHWPDVRVLGTNPAQAELLRINPFAFPSDVHVLEHVDRLVEIFNVCWPMYAAMPAVLKDAILQTYEACGWDLAHSTLAAKPSSFPGFLDLLATLRRVINDSEYAAETKSNYLGALCTRVKSLANGVNGQILGVHELPDAALFDQPVIVDLSRVGSVETKSLIMGILVMRLAEHRMSQGGMNLPLRHVTVLEEAHNILRRSSASEDDGLVRKSVEMLTNAIAEMRTHGEGFVIADQSPHAVDIAAIRNTSTKLILRLPEETDRRVLGKSVGLSDDQIDEIARLPRGVAVVHQNDWLEPVLCQVDRFTGQMRAYVREGGPNDVVTRGEFLRQTLHLLLAHRLRQAPRIELARLRQGLHSFGLLTRCRQVVERALNARLAGVPFLEQSPEHFGELASLVVDVLQCRADVRRAIYGSTDYADLHRRLDELLRVLVPGMGRAVRLAAEQCLVRDHISEEPSHGSIYEGWTSYLQGAMET